MSEPVSEADTHADAILASLRRGRYSIPRNDPTLLRMREEYGPSQPGLAPDPSGTEPESTDLPEFLGELVERYYRENVSRLSEALQSFCSKNVRARGIRTDEIEGFISESPTKKYAIIVTTGLMTFLKKIHYLDTAISDPTTVVHCNRCDVHALNEDLLRQFRADVVSNFRNGISDGAILLLDRKSASNVQVLLFYQENFVICHEIGHLISDFILDGSALGEMHPSAGSMQHRSEYMADIFGFALLELCATFEQAVPGDRGRWLDDRIRLLSICSFFEILQLAFPSATATHPSPHDRACNIIRSFYGRDFAAHYDGWRRGKIPALDWDSVWVGSKTPLHIAMWAGEFLIAESPVC